MPKLVVYRRLVARRNQRWRWRLVAANGKKLCHGGEGYANRDDCLEIARAILRGRYGDASFAPLILS